MTTYATKAKDVEKRHWHVIDADGQVLGRLASEAAGLLRGKHNPLYAPNLDCGDHVIVINAARVRVTGRKLEQKNYFRYSGYPGGAKNQLLRHRMAIDPDEVIREAIRGMLPKGPLGRQMLRKVKIYRGSEHPPEAQTPKPYTLDKKKSA